MFDRAEGYAIRPIMSPCERKFTAVTTHFNRVSVKLVWVARMNTVGTESGPSHCKSNVSSADDYGRAVHALVKSA